MNRDTEPLDDNNARARVIFSRVEEEKSPEHNKSEVTGYHRALHGSLPLSLYVHACARGCMAAG